MVLDWLIGGTKTDHPMNSVEAARSLLADLPRDPLQALEEATSWHTTFTAASGIKLPMRIAITRLIDEAAQASERRISDSLTSPSVKEFTRMQHWKAVLAYWRAAGDAYAACLQGLQDDPKRAGLTPEDLAVLHVRILRALNMQDKLLHMRYEPLSEQGERIAGLKCVLSPATATRKAALRTVPIRRSVWEPMLKFYRSSVAMKCDTTRVNAYARERTPTTPQQELVSGLVLQAASPEGLLPRQVELASRVAARYGSSFLFSGRTGEGCNWFVDLAVYDHEGEAAPDAATIRYFGAGAAVDKIERLVEDLTEDPDSVEDPLDINIPVHDQIVTLRQLVTNWKSAPPLRKESRPVKRAMYEVAHGFDTACHLLVRKPKTHPAGEIPADTGSVALERWLLKDSSTWGLGVRLPRKTESWISVGALCPMREVPNGPWFVAVVRRLFRDSTHQPFAGLEILSKKPRVLTLRGLGTGVPDQWTGPGGRLARGAFRVVMLEDNAAAPFNEILVARQAFLPGVVYDVLWRKSTRQLRMDEQFEQGDDFDRGTFTWLS